MRRNLILVMVGVFFFFLFPPQTFLRFSTLYYAHFQIHCYVIALSGKRRKGRAEKLIMFCDKVYILFSNWYSRDTRNQLLFWRLHVLFLPESGEMSKKPKCTQLLNTKKEVSFSIMWNYFILWDIFVSAYQCISM